ncbi:MAG: hypothetical protein ACO1SV_18060 [Fimbriimonas sp.]
MDIGLILILLLMGLVVYVTTIPSVRIDLYRLFWGYSEERATAYVTAPWHLAGLKGLRAGMAAFAIAALTLEALGLHQWIALAAFLCLGLGSGIPSGIVWLRSEH